jgi:hypothetical protein
VEPFSCWRRTSRTVRNAQVNLEPDGWRLESHGYTFVPLGVFPAYGWRECGRCRTRAAIDSRRLQARDRLQEHGSYPPALEGRVSLNASNYLTAPLPQ